MQRKKKKKHLTLPQLFNPLKPDLQPCRLHLPLIVFPPHFHSPEEISIQYVIPVFYRGKAQA